MNLLSMQVKTCILVAKVLSLFKSIGNQQGNAMDFVEKAKAVYLKKIVAPTNVGSEIDWTIFRGRVTDVWMAPGNSGELMAWIVWFGPARLAIRSASSWPISMIRVAE